MKTLRSLAVLLLLLSCVDSLSGQGRYKQGRLVLLTDDTIRVLIYDRGGRHNCLTILARELAEPYVEVVYRPGQIKGFMVEPGACYESGLLDGEAVFFRRWVTGTADLLAFTAGDESQRLLLRKGGKLSPLGQVDRGTVMQHQQHRQVREERRQEVEEVLRQELGSCQELLGEIGGIELKVSALAGLVDRYNCLCGTSLHCDPLVYSNRPRSGFEISAGVLFSRVEIKQPGMMHFDQSEFRNRTGIRAGLSATFHFPLWDDGLGMLWGLYFQQKGMATKPGNTFTRGAGSPEVPLEIRFDLDYLNLAWGMRYRWNKGKCSPCLEGGISVAYLLGSYSRSFYAAEDGLQVGYVFDPEDSYKTEVGFRFLFGLSYRLGGKHSLQCGIHYENGLMTGGTRARFSNRSTGVLLGLTF